MDESIDFAENIKRKGHKYLEEGLGVWFGARMINPWFFLVIVFEFVDTNNADALDVKKFWLKKIYIYSKKKSIDFPSEASRWLGS